MDIGPTWTLGPRGHWAHVDIGPTWTLGPRDRVWIFSWCCPGALAPVVRNASGVAGLLARARSAVQAVRLPSVPLSLSPSRAVSLSACPASLECMGCPLEGLPLPLSVLTARRAQCVFEAFGGWAPKFYKESLQCVTRNAAGQLEGDWLCAYQTAETCSCHFLSLRGKTLLSSPLLPSQLPSLLLPSPLLRSSAPPLLAPAPREPFLCPSRQETDSNGRVCLSLLGISVVEEILLLRRSWAIEGWFCSCLWRALGVLRQTKRLLPLPSPPFPSLPLP